MTEEIRQGTKCHFDYMALLVASSAISALGLATDNVAVVVAAMLVSAGFCVVGGYLCRRHCCSVFSYVVLVTMVG